MVLSSEPHTDKPNTDTGPVLSCTVSHGHLRSCVGAQERGHDISKKERKKALAPCRYACDNEVDVSVLTLVAMECVKPS